MALILGVISSPGHVRGLHRQDVVRAAAAERRGVRAAGDARRQGELRAQAGVDHQDHEEEGAVPGAGRVCAGHLLAGDHLLHRGARHDVRRGQRRRLLFGFLG